MVSMPADMLLARSIGYNIITAKGASVLAAILKETQITKLKCAAAPECSLLCHCPLTKNQTLCGSSL